jgi:hydrogenase maturation protease
MRTVVIGVGNPYRRDDGVGSAVIERLRRLGVKDTRLEESDGEPSELLTLWTGADLAIVVDAVRTAAVHPGRVHCRELADARPVNGRPASTHRVDLGDAVALALAVDRLPARLVLYGVEVAETAYGPGLSPAAEAAADAVAAAILARITGGEEARDVPS